MSRQAKTIVLALGGLFLLLIVAGSAMIVWQRRGAVKTMTSALMPADDRQSIIVLGDSFAENPHFQDQFPRAMSGRVVVIDGVGGSTLDQQRRRFNERINQWKSFLVILDGGLDDSNAVRPVADIVAQLDPGCRRWLYVEPPHSTINGPAGSDVYRHRAELADAVRRRWPDHFVSLIAPLAAGAQPSAEDQRSIQSGWTPASLRKENDPLHLNAAGNAILVRVIAEAIVRAERQPLAPCRGATVEQMQTAANAS